MVKTQELELRQYPCNRCYRWTWHIKGTDCAWHCLSCRAMSPLEALAFEVTDLFVTPEGVIHA